MNDEELTDKEEDALLCAFGEVFLALPPDEQERLADKMGFLDVIIEEWNRKAQSN